MHSLIPKPLDRKVPLKKLSPAELERLSRTCSNCGARLERGTGAKIVIQPSCDEHGMIWAVELVPLCGPCVHFQPNAAGGVA